MATLTQIIKDDFRVVGQVLRGAARGAVQGIYTPALMNTGMRQVFGDSRSKPIAEITAQGETQIISAVGVHVPLAAYAIEHGRGWEYFGALAATNVVDYLVHAYRRSKK